jgi:hypothetical protein
MASSCPDCGNPAEFVARPLRVYQGTCSGCGHTFTIVGDTPAELSESPGAGPAEPSGSPTGPPSGASGPRGTPSAQGPPCGNCGSSLALRSTSDSTIEGSCASCGSSFSFELARPGFRPRGGEREERGPPGGRPGFGPSRARPCRECGAPLRFSTGTDGTVTGECTSCGNRFTLPRRREFDRGGEGRETRGRPGRPFSPGYRGSARWQPRAGGDRRPSYRAAPTRFRRRERGGDDDEDDEGDRRRRRPRRE